jgi:hypothetical protein
MIPLLLAAQLATAPIDAAPAAPGVGSAPCIVQTAPANTPFAGNLMFLCWSRAVPLGKADRFSSSYNPGTRATAVVMESAGRIGVVLISPTADNAPLVENVTGDLAKLAGRYAEAGLEGLSVDLAHFATDGVLSLANGSTTGAARSAGAGRPALDGTRAFDTRPSAARAARLSDAFDVRQAARSNAERSDR